MVKTNVIRLLELRNIKHTVKEYIFDENEIDAVSVANKINANPEQVFKTLLTRGDKTGPVVFVIPGNFSLDLKKAASISGNKKIEMIKEKELFPLTGYIKGGCSPIGMKRNFKTFIDETAQMWENIYVSAGLRGLQVCLIPDDLKNVSEADFGDLI
ncbi:MAG: Cys-tRNA(Pro) deacylase [Bacteroidetes bacterium]|nr:Cys-tRNA(Pro) deacylase [Bacteroidota bacterium]